MSKLLEEIEKREVYLRNIIKRATSDSNIADAGNIRICHRKNTVMLYLMTDGKARYLKKSETDIAHRLIQKNYALRVLSSASKELELLERIKAEYAPGEILTQYTSLSPYRRALLVPYEFTSEEYSSEWQNAEADLPQMPIEIKGNIFSNKGEQVRSKSEKIIADELFRFGIPYKYEQCLKLGSGEMVFPDFTALNSRTRQQFYWEHMGMMDDTNYIEHNTRKIEKYEMNGIWPGENLLMTFETKETCLNSRLVDRIIEKYLM